MSGSGIPGTKILLAEDEMLVAMDVEAFLQDDGYDVCGIAATAAEAIELAARHHPHLAIMDVNLASGSNGLDGVRVLMTRWNIPAIVVSGHANRQDAIAAGAVGWLQKPFRSEDLSRLVAYVLSRSQGGGDQVPPPRGWVGEPAGAITATVSAT